MPHHTLATSTRRSWPTLTFDSGGIQCVVWPRDTDPWWGKKSGSGINIPDHILRELGNTFFGLNMLKFFVNSQLGSGSRIRCFFYQEWDMSVHSWDPDPGSGAFLSGMGTSGSGINIPDPQICVTASLLWAWLKGQWRETIYDDKLRFTDFLNRKFCLCLRYWDNCLKRPIPVRRLRHPESDCIFSTGTDEHGLKIQQAAALAGQLIIRVIKGAKVWDFRSLGLFWFLHHKVSSGGRFFRVKIIFLQKYLGVHLLVWVWVAFKTICYCQ